MNNRKRITPQYLSNAVRSDVEFAQIWDHVTIPAGGVLPNINRALLRKLKPKKGKGKAKALYSRIVKGKGSGEAKKKRAADAASPNKSSAPAVNKELGSSLASSTSNVKQGTYLRCMSM